MEETLKMRNLLEEFDSKTLGLRSPTILGVREHVFTGRYGLWFSGIKLGGMHDTYALTTQKYDSSTNSVK